MNELYRILKPKGTCFIQTPFKEGEIYEDYNITTEAGRLKAFGQKDHVRVYSLQDLMNRLKAVKSNNEVITFTPTEKDTHGWLSEDVIKVTK